MKGSFIDKKTGKVLAAWITKSDKPRLSSQIFLEGERPDEGKILDLSQYPEKNIWIDDPEFVEAMSSQKSKQIERQQKLEGVEIDGVMCSATKEDDDGLTKVYVSIKNNLASEFNFEFSNGNKLLINSDNIDSFAAIWFPFRQSFFG